MNDDAQPDPQNPPGDVEKDALPGVEADETAFVVGSSTRKRIAGMMVM
jgi:hypothetical protein